MEKDERTVDDPLLREAVLELFRANQQLRSAYDAYARTHGRDRHAIEALADAEARVDLARERVVDRQLQG